MKIRKPTFRFNLYSIFIISILIPFSIASLTFTIYYNYIMGKQNTQNTSNLLTSVARNVHTQLTELKTISTTCYMHSNILDSMKSFNNPKLYSYYDSLELNRLENDYTIAMTKLMFTSQQVIYNISFFPMSGSNSFYSLSKNSASIKRILWNDYQTQPWFSLAKEANGDLIFYPEHIPYYLGQDNTPPVFSAVKLIVDMDSKKHIGVLKIDSPISNLEQLTANMDSGSNQHLLIIDSEGNAMTGHHNLPAQLPLRVHPELDSEDITIDSQRYYATYFPITGTQWNLVYLSDTQAESRHILLSLFISFSCMALGILTAFAIYQNRSNTLVHSVNNITDTIRQFESGNWTARSTVSSNNELKIISEELNTMAEKLEHHIQREYISVINQQKANYKALQSQINPHFLYNTLNGFIALNRMGEQKKLEKSILHLTHLFQYTCHQEDSTTLNQEVYFLEEYLKLQKLKYDNRLEFEIWISPECNEFSIPKLLLQPIIENSIIHGLEPTEKTIHIKIVCQKILIKGIDPVILILLEDDGIGYNPKEIAKKERVGLRNVKERTMLFHSNAICHMDSTPGCGAKTMFVFPYIEGERT